MNFWFNVSTNCIMLKKIKQERLLKKFIYNIFHIYQYYKRIFIFSIENLFNLEVVNIAKHKSRHKYISHEK